MKIQHMAFGVVSIGLLAATGVWAFSKQRPIAPFPPVIASVEHDDGDDETIITLADLPPAVRAALAGITPDAAVTQVARETDDGATTYDVEYTKNGTQWAVEFSEAGAVLENEPDSDDDHE